MNTDLHADWADSMAAWSEENAAELRCFTGLPACSGDCDQGRKACDCAPQPAEACTELGAEDQAVSADAEVAVFLVKCLLVLLGVMFAAWVIAGMP